MPNLTTLQEALRSPVDGTEYVRLATPGANWKAQLQILLETIGIFHVAGVPPTATSPGTPFTYTLDGSCNLYICLAPNQWSKFTGDITFGIAHSFLLLRDGVSHLLLRNGVDRLLLGHQ